jgi:hypothetical protein
MSAVALRERPVVREQSKAASKQKRAFVAKPVRGEIDFKALRKNVKQRFPQTIAHLAK